MTTHGTLLIYCEYHVYQPGEEAERIIGTHHYILRCIECRGKNTYVFDIIADLPLASTEASNEKVEK